MASLEIVYFCSYKPPTILIMLLLTTKIEPVFNQKPEWEIEVALFEDEEGQHPGTTQRAKEAYLTELFISVSRRLELLQLGRFHIIRTSLRQLSKAESQALFLKSGRQATMNDVFNNWKTLLAKPLSGDTRGKDMIVIFTRRSLTTPNGYTASGFAIKGSMCTADNIAVVQDDGNFLAVNKLAKILVHASVTCMKKRATGKGSKPLPAPLKISRKTYCMARRSTHCDDTGMQTVEHQTPEKTDCFVFCCKNVMALEKLVAPDGLYCGNDITQIIDRRCLNGKCEQVT
ncbi:uncharacterized protein LOC119458413 isoform X2 [Dermacentor silvarum]|uniref:uncharacterized protein LOC119458413 isoform X2 n=1 Tax=Dermacentor silvarum TaxID=543639 RepID=UPI00189B1724|nr:uncharacterized protein LOC119458413 isoform X2 [Dermacentor silvarum]